MLDEYVVQDSMQARAILNPARLRVLLAFDVPKTSAQVAREIGEVPNRVGHHIRLLRQLGLLVMCYRQGRRVFLERKARNFRIPFSLTPYSSLEEALGLASAEILQLLRQAVVHWQQELDEEFILVGEDFPKLPRSPVKILDLVLTSEQVAMLEEMLRNLSNNGKRGVAGRRYKLAVLLAPVH